uniref:Receptor ligand binding region domain-containing protein n=1 Tax=Amphimedon queenslandica TaxID=400682 RepID=A0A1X7T057_AMPQE
MCKLLFYFWFIAPFISTIESATKSTLQFGYITTITGSFVASGGRPAVDLALQIINERDDILQNYTLAYTDILDSGVTIFNNNNNNFLFF